MYPQTDILVLQEPKRYIFTPVGHWHKCIYEDLIYLCGDNKCSEPFDSPCYICGRIMREENVLETIP